MIVASGGPLDRYTTTWGTTIDCTLAELELLLDAAEIIEEVDLEPNGTKELLLVIDWTRPLHIVVVVDSLRREERLVTVYEPDAERWTDGYRRRR